MTRRSLSSKIISKFILKGLISLISPFFLINTTTSFNFNFLDGDKIRKWISFDLGYSLSDRKIQIKRVLGLAKISIESEIFPIISTVYMDQKLITKLKKNGILLINILRDFKKIKNRKKIYSKEVKNVIGKDIKAPKLKDIYTIKNNTSLDYFKKKIERIINE